MPRLNNGELSPSLSFSTVGGNAISLPGRLVATEVVGMVKYLREAA
jgi:hypothetical protein